MNFSTLLESVLRHEGFRSKPYLDTLGVSTFGHGLTWISEGESRTIVQGRLVQAWGELVRAHPFLESAPDAVQRVTVEMAYQLGVSGALRFVKMWTALEKSEYELAAEEMLDSTWAKQTPGRAQELSSLISALS